MEVLKDDLGAVRRLLQYFEKCDDQYILERLFLIAYRFAIYEKDEQKKFQELVNYINNTIFCNTTREPNIIIDQCARDIIMLYQDRYGGLSADFIDNINPPYDYDFRPSGLFSVKTILKKYCGESCKNDCSTIINSVLYPHAVLADFGNYTMGGLLSHLTNIGISEKIDTVMVGYKTFLESLSDGQYDVLNQYYNALSYNKNKSISRFMVNLLGKKEQVISISGGKRNAKRTKDDFVKTLSIRQRRMLTDEIARCVFSGRRVVDPYRQRNYDMVRARRWVFWNVLRLGWQYNLHGEFDVAHYQYNSMRGGSSIGRLERVGKKYQWISLHQFMALASSNYFLYDKYGGDILPRLYNGSLEFNDRDFDPTIPVDWVVNNNGRLYEEYYDEGGEKEECANLLTPWWKIKCEILDEDDWLLTTDDIPKMSQLISFMKGDDRFVSLINWSTWKKKYSDGRYRQFRVYVDSCIVKVDDLQKIKDWYDDENSDFMVEDSPILESYDDVFLGEILRDTPVYRDRVKGTLNSEDFMSKVPFSAKPTTVEYNGGSFELGPIMQHRIEMPSPFLRALLNLKWVAPASFINKEKGYKIFYPLSEQNMDGQYILFASSNIISALADMGYTILWIGRGEKQEIEDLRPAPDSICMRGYAYMDNDGQIVDFVKFFKVSDRFRK